MKDLYLTTTALSVICSKLSYLGLEENIYTAGIEAGSYLGIPGHTGSYLGVQVFTGNHLHRQLFTGI